MFICFLLRQERRRSERAEIQRVRAEKEKDRQNRIAVRPKLGNVSDKSCKQPRCHSPELCVSSVRRSATGRRRRRPRRRLTMTSRRRKCYREWEQTLEASWQRSGQAAAAAVVMATTRTSFKPPGRTVFVCWPPGRVEEGQTSDWQRDQEEDAG